MSFSDEDRAALAAHGIAEAEAERQLAMLRAPARYVELDRPCTPGDGIEAAESGGEDEAAHAAAARAGRVSLFIPASGAASRMFKDLLAHPPGSEPAGAVRAFFEGVARFAFAPALARVLGEDPAAAAARGEHARVLEALLGEEGLGYAQLPKGLLAFHSETEAGGSAALTPLEEHLVEAAELVRDDRGVARLHFTVSPEHEERFRALLALAAGRLGPRLATRFEVGFSTQKPSTDTVAVDGSGALFRDADGQPLFRPAGHGALLANLGDLQGDLVYLKNIDNVAAAPWRAESLRVGRILVGRLARLQRRCFELLARLDDPADAAAVADAARFAAEELRRAAPAERGALREALDRPLRVCGMVKNTGEPGGGPFWVRDKGGEVSRQIVESSQVDPAAAEQKRLLSTATHFNPVLLACALRDRAGAPYPLDAYVDAEAVIITRKSSGGRELVALERPGLWNGAMARWNTVFVEVPLLAFNPVKTVNDLLRREHQPG